MSHAPTKERPTSRVLATTCASLMAIVTATGGCSRTDVLQAPHADPFQTSTGHVLHRRAFSAAIDLGIVAVNDGRSDVTWQTREAGREIWACSKARSPSCRQAEFVGGEPLKDAIRFLAPPMGRQVVLEPPPMEDAQEEEAASPARPKSPEDDEGRPKLALPGHGVWATGKVRFLTAALFYCTVENAGPRCVKVSEAIVPFTAFSRHLVRRDSAIEDVLWTSAMLGVTRCRYVNQRASCQLATFNTSGQ